MEERSTVPGTWGTKAHQSSVCRRALLSYVSSQRCFATLYFPRNRNSTWIQETKGAEVIRAAMFRDDPVLIIDFSARCFKEANIPKTSEAQDMSALPHFVKGFAKRICGKPLWGPSWVGATRRARCINQAWGGTVPFGESCTVLWNLHCTWWSLSCVPGLHRNGERVCYQIQQRELLQQQCPALWGGTHAIHWCFAFHNPYCAWTLHRSPSLRRILGCSWFCSPQ